MTRASIGQTLTRTCPLRDCLTGTGASTFAVGSSPEQDIANRTFDCFVMHMHWREPLNWNRVNKARALARIRPWWLFCGASAAVLLAGCLFVHIVQFAYVLQQTFVGAERFSELQNDILMSAGCCVVMLSMPLCIFLVFLIPRSIGFLPQTVVVSNGYIRAVIPYEKVSSIDFVRFDDMTYLVVRGMPYRYNKEIEFCIALTEKYSVADIADYLRQHDMVGILSEPHDVSVSPKQSEMPSNLLWVERGGFDVVGRKYFSAFVFAFWIVMVNCLCDVVMARTFSEVGLMLVIIAAWWIEAFVWKRLLGKGAGRKYETLVEGLTPRKMFTLSIPYVLTLIFNPALVADALWRMSFDLKTVCCLTAVWQLVWTVAVYSTGRLFRRENT